MKTESSKYHCTQPELYEVCRTGWENCRSELSKFSAFKARYNNAFIDARLLAVDAAEALPDEHVRNSHLKVALLAVKETAAGCLIQWQALKMYIHTAYGGELEKAKLDAAGMPYYADAAAGNSDAVKALMNDGLAFINENEVRLKFEKNMPASFPATFTTLKNLFATALKSFTKIEEDIRIQTAAKVAANNGIHEQVMEMFLDGQFIFRSEPAKKSKYVFDDVLEIFAHHLADIKGTISTGVAHLPLAGAVVSIPELAESVVTDEEGRYDFGVIPHGNYTISIVKDGFAPQSLQVEVPTGTTITRNFDLIAA